MVQQQHHGDKWLMCFVSGCYKPWIGESRSVVNTFFF